MTKNMFILPTEFRKYHIIFGSFTKSNTNYNVIKKWHMLVTPQTCIVAVEKNWHITHELK